MYNTLTSHYKLVLRIRNQSEKMDPDPHQSQNSGAMEAQSVNQWSQIGITLMRNRIWILDPHQSWIRIHIKVIKLDPGPHQSEKLDPDPHQSEKLDPHPNQRDADPQYFTITNLLTLSCRRKCSSDNRDVTLTDHNSVLQTVVGASL
jgi:hypothetical protein